MRFRGAVALRVAGLALICGALAGAQRITPRERVLARVLFRYRAEKTLVQSVTGRFTVRSQGITVPIEVGWEATLAQPNRFRIATKIGGLGRQKHGLYISDGATVWETDDEGKHYSRQPLTAIAKTSDALTDWLMDRAIGDLALMLFLEQAGGKILGVPPGLERALGKTIDLKDVPSRVVDGVAMYVVPVPFDESGNKGTATLYVDTKDLLVRRCRYSARTPGEKRSDPPLQVDVVLFYNDIKPGVTLPESAFAWTPPSDYTQVKQVKTAFDRVLE